MTSVMVTVMDDSAPKPAPKPVAAPPRFDDAFAAEFAALLRWRRDVRRFLTAPLPSGLLDELLGLAMLAPSVGNSQPWRFVLVESETCRKAVRAHFEACNAQALNDYEGERAKLYARLKLSGLDTAPVQIAVYCDRATVDGHGLGRKTMPETLDYSAAMAIHTLWLAARACGVGLGWVSIVEPQKIDRILDAPAGWRFIAYLCLGWPEEEHEDPELVRHGWQDRLSAKALITRR